ncbi:MAG: sigma 54-interacting transcriptional regulator, partial [Gammaproteobacteria bacterium]
MAWTDPHLHSARALLDLPVTEANRRVMAHREAFLGAGAAHEARPVIAASWTRVRELGVDPAAERAPLVMSLENVDEILRTQQLGRSGRQVLDRFAPLAEGSRHVIVLADEHGRILYEVGHRGVYEGLEAMNFVPGGDWSEAAVGPNGIGTPLSLGRPEIVLGAEHYCEGWQPWVCYGAPVCDPETGRPLGAVDITGPSGAADMQTLALTISIAQSLEQQLELQALQNRDHLRSEFREMERRWPGDALMLLSDGGRILDVNGVAVQALDLDRVVHAERALAAVLPDLWLLARDLVQTGRYGERRGEVRLENGAQPQLECRVQPLHHGQRKIGAVLILSGFLRLLAGAPTRTAREAATPLVTFDDILGTSAALAAAKRLCSLAACDDASVLLVGETGMGKEMFAQGIHGAGPRRARPFVAVNCGALPRELAASELFGYEAGSFTGADRKGRAGKFEVADGGTLFLDE